MADRRVGAPAARRVDAAALRPTGASGGAVIGMGSAPPPGGSGCGNAPTPPAPPRKALRADGLEEHQAGRVIVRVFVDGQAVPFSGASDAGGYFFIPFIPEGREFAAIAYDTLSGEGRSVFGVGPPTGSSVRLDFDFFSAQPGNVSGTVRAGAGVVVRALSDATNNLSALGQATTDGAGRYRLPKLPAGSYTLESRALNHARAVRAITVADAGEVVADLAVTALAPIAPAKVYVVSSGNEPSDQTVMEVLRNGGHQPTLGVGFNVFDGTQAVLGDHEVVLLLNNHNWNSGFMPDAGATAVAAYVAGGGGVVTCEWLVWNIAARYRGSPLAEIVPVTGGPFSSGAATTYSRATPDSVVDRDLPEAPFTFPLGNLSGSESWFTLKPGAVAFYRSDHASDGPRLAGELSVAAALRDVGTRNAADVLGAEGFDVPTLVGLHATAPYLHDGSAATLEEVLENPAHLRVSLEPDELAALAALAAFLRSIDDTTAPFAAPQ